MISKEMLHWLMFEAEASEELNNLLLAAEGLKEARLECVEKLMPELERGKIEEAWVQLPRRTHLVFFLLIKDSLDDKRYYSLLGEALNDIYIADYGDELAWALLDARPKKFWKYLTPESEWKRLASLKDGICYRGCSEENLDGWCWTLDKVKAKFFANRHEGKVFILKGRYKKADVISYNSRESEIFIHPCAVKITGKKSWLNENPQSNYFQWLAHRNICDRVFEFPEVNAAIRRTIAEYIDKYRTA